MPSVVFFLNDCVDDSICVVRFVDRAMSGAGRMSGVSGGTEWYCRRTHVCVNRTTPAVFAKKLPINNNTRSKGKIHNDNTFMVTGFHGGTSC